VVDNVAAVLRLNGMAKSKARERALDMMDRVGLDRSMAKRYPGQLSGGSNSALALRERSRQNQISCSWTNLLAQSTRLCAASCKMSCCACKRIWEKPLSL